MTTLLLFLLTLLTDPPAAAAARVTTSPVRVDSVLPNDNRIAGGVLRGDVLELALEARLAGWRPDAAVDSLVTVQVFAEEGGAPRIPGPLLRATSGREVRVTVRNRLATTLVVHGLRAGAFATDTVHVAPGAVREVRFRAGPPGTYLYWGSTTGEPIGVRSMRDSQLAGAIVIDAPGVPVDTTERIFVMSVIDVAPFDTARNKAKEDIWDLAINGRSWPHTERLSYDVGDTVRWRWINASYLPHPMHLHGFHFRVLSKGENNADTTYTPGGSRLAVTEFMVAGSTFRMDWVPTRGGNWLMHCHMIPHITPFPERPDSARGHDAHDVSRHPLTGMSGLVLGVSTVDRRAMSSAPAPVATQRFRLFAQQAPAPKGAQARRGYVLQRGGAPRADSVEVPGSPLVLVRGVTSAITVVNRLREPTTVHWHGMELESVYDGVSGWSRSGTSVAPLLAPGDSFTVVITPPRAGTYLYHTHMDEGAQLRTGLYAPLIVLEPGERFDAATDLPIILGDIASDTGSAMAINGERVPRVRTLRAGTRYRLRLINIVPAAPARVELLAHSLPLAWRPVSKDGAALPASRRIIVPSRLRRLGTGETYDFEWTPARAMDATLVAYLEDKVLRLPFKVVAR